MSPRVVISRCQYGADRKGAHLNAGILALGALKGLLMSVFVASVPDELSAGDKRHVAVSALVGPGSWKNHVVYTFQTRLNFETSSDFLVLERQSERLQQLRSSLNYKYRRCTETELWVTVSAFS